ncbi:MAG: L,D-transpeptidase family protein [Lachnospiraceae bacterium]|nr:L,D-transpeptidase family protein [Lachnospiraceae bacterium]
MKRRYTILLVLLIILLSAYGLYIRYENKRMSTANNTSPEHIETSPSEDNNTVSAKNNTPEPAFAAEAGDAPLAIIVESSGTDASVSMYERDDIGSWTKLLETSGYVGSDGVGEASEDRTATPEGVYNITYAFGILPDPGCGIDYLTVDDSYYWVDDTDSKYYNRFVSTDDVAPDWDSAEHITEVGYPYNYVLAFDYNADCIPGKGSAFFLHCTQNKPTHGCITVPEEDMVSILRHLQPGCVIIIH